MTGYEIYNKAITRLGYKSSGNDEVLDSRIAGRASEFINQILLDLKLDAISHISEPVNCSEEMCEALCCGVAMLLSLSEGDTNKNVIFTALYNAKRAAALSKTAFIEDNLPVAEG